MSLLGDIVRSVSAPARLLPDFLIIGAMKCGTSSLFRYLEAHPNVAVSRPKEVHYFDDNAHRSLNWYRKHFPIRFSKDGRAALRCGEASPYYLFCDTAPDRVKAALPDARLIVMLRDPVARAYSHYHHVNANGHDDRTFAQAVEAEITHIESRGAHPLHPTHPPEHASRRLQYLARGIYADQLTRWFDRFDRSRVLVLRSESMFADPRAVYNEALALLELPPHDEIDFTRRNPGRYAEPMAPEVRDRLRAFFAPHNLRLEQLLGAPMHWGNAADE